jgi:hypothetical protein
MHSQEIRQFRVGVHISGSDLSFSSALLPAKLPALKLQVGETHEVILQSNIPHM